MTAGAVLGIWAAAVGIGGARCADRELRSWVNRAPIVVSAREGLQERLVAAQLERLEQDTGWPSNPEAVEVAEEFWDPLVAPLADLQWSGLREPVVAFLVARHSCHRAWRLNRDLAALDPETAIAFEAFWEDALREPVRADAVREDLGRLFDDRGDAFAPQVREVLPGPPGADETW